MGGNAVRCEERSTSRREALQVRSRRAQPDAITGVRGRTQCGTQGPEHPWPAPTRRGRPCTDSAASTRRHGRSPLCIASSQERSESSVATAKRRRTDEIRPPREAWLRTKSSDQWARRVRHARATHRHRTDHHYGHHQGAKPRQGANRPHRTTSTKDRRAPARKDAGARRPGRESERPLSRHWDHVGSARHIEPALAVPEAGSTPRAVAHARSPRGSSAAGVMVADDGCTQREVVHGSSEE